MKVLLLIGFIIISFKPYACTREYEQYMHSLPSTEMMMNLYKDSKIAFIGKAVRTYRINERQGIVFDVSESLKGDAPKYIDATYYGGCGYKMLLPKYDKSMGNEWPFRLNEEYLIFGEQGEFDFYITATEKISDAIWTISEITNANKSIKQD